MSRWPFDLRDRAHCSTAPTITCVCENWWVPTLTVVGGLPGTGKSTIAHLVAERTLMPFLRVDRIEHAIVAWSSLSHPVGGRVMPSPTRWRQSSCS